MKRASAKLFDKWITPQLDSALVAPFFSTFPKGDILVVGGAVRDALLGRGGKRDLDLLMVGVPGTRLEAFLRTRGKVNYVGRRFGVWKFSAGAGSDTVDIALPRTEKPKKTGGYRDVIVESRADLPVKEDLARRDFTINAMAWSLKSNSLIDPFGGMKDMSKRVIRAVRNPDERFAEDYTRILRALRFAVELDATIAPATWQALKKKSRMLVAKRQGQPIVPAEMVAKEFLKSLAADPYAALVLWDKANVLDVLLPEAIAMKGCTQPRNFHTEGDVWTHALLAVKTLSSPGFRRAYPSGWNAEIALTVFLHDIAKPATKKNERSKSGAHMTFIGHDVLGAVMAEAIVDRLALTSYKSERVEIDRGRVSFAIKHHLLAVHGHPEDMLATTLEKYFFNDPVSADLLLKVMYCDGAATIAEGGKPCLGPYRVLLKRLAEISHSRTGTVRLPPPLIDGLVIMKLLKLAPSPKIGEIIRSLREAQLTGAVTTPTAARAWIGKTYGGH